MNFTDLQHGAEKAIVFTLAAMTIKSYFSLKQPALKTAMMIAGAAWFFDHEPNSKESLITLTTLGSLHLIHETFFGEIGGDNYYE